MTLSKYGRHNIASLGIVPSLVKNGWATEAMAWFGELREKQHLNCSTERNNSTWNGNITNGCGPLE